MIALSKKIAQALTLANRGITSAILTHNQKLLVDEVAALEAPPWVDASEQLPEFTKKDSNGGGSEWYWVSLYDGLERDTCDGTDSDWIFEVVGRFVYDDIAPDDHYWIDRDCNKIYVTHYMPLPPAPEQP